MKSIAVFCASSLGTNKIYEQAAYAVGQALAREGLRIVYGGGKVGLMGVVADAALAAGGEVIGVIPRALFDREVGHAGLTDLRIVDSMHARKQLIADLSDAFIALPGGAGTLEEIFEQWTWSQLGIHQKPCAVLNVNNYFAPLRAMVDQAVAEGFTKPTFAAMLAIEDDLEKLLDRFRNYRPGPHKWTPENEQSVRP
ncbi:MAG TPA: TIGR00730 family Rossman fold protein [Candidatus Acidoferrales bacterium]